MVEVSLKFVAGLSLKLSKQKLSRRLQDREPWTTKCSPKVHSMNFIVRIWPVQPGRRGSSGYSVQSGPWLSFFGAVPSWSMISHFSVVQLRSSEPIGLGPWITDFLVDSSGFTFFYVNPFWTERSMNPCCRS